MTPRRAGAPAGNASQLAMRQPLTTRLPCVLARAKSRPCLMRRPRGKPSAADGTGVMPARGYTGVRRLRPLRRRLARMARPLLVEVRLREPCLRFRRVFYRLGLRVPRAHEAFLAL